MKVVQTPPENDKPTAPKSQPIYTVPEASDYVRLSRSALYGLMASGKLRYHQIGRARRISHEALVELLASCEQGGWAAGGDA